MKTALLISFFLTQLILLVPEYSFTQSTTVLDTIPKTDVGKDSAINKIDIYLPPLSEAIDSAIKYNTMLRYRNLEVNLKELNLTSQKNYWLRNLGVQGDSRYGTIDAFSTNANGVTTNSSLTTSRQFNYAAGVYFKMPIYDILNRKVQIKQAKTELEEAKTMVEAQQVEIRQLVIRQYQATILSQKILDIKSFNLGSATVNMDMIEKEFRNGVIPLAEYVRIADMTARIQTDYEMAKSDFLLAKQILEEICGFKFEKNDTK
jgi:outer membrane protein TolC